MPQIANQDYIVIAPKEGRAFSADAAALGQLKKCVLNGTAFDCLIRDVHNDGHSVDRVLGHYLDNSSYVLVSDMFNDGLSTIEIPEYTLEQFAGLAALQNVEDEAYELMDKIPALKRYAPTEGSELFVGESDCECYVCVGGKYLKPEENEGKLTGLALSESGPEEDFVNITWEDALKLIGLPIG